MGTQSNGLTRVMGSFRMSEWGEVRGRMDSGSLIQGSWGTRHAHSPARRPRRAPKEEQSISPAAAAAAHHPTHNSHSLAVELATKNTAALCLHRPRGRLRSNLQPIHTYTTSESNQGPAGQRGAVGSREAAAGDKPRKPAGSYPLRGHVQASSRGAASHQGRSVTIGARGAGSRRRGGLGAAERQWQQHEIAAAGRRLRYPIFQYNPRPWRRCGLLLTAAAVQGGSLRRAAAMIGSLPRSLPRSTTAARPPEARTPCSSSSSSSSSTRYV